MTIPFLFLLIFAYLVGSFASGIVLCRLTNRPDPRHAGSGNIGATNVLRLTGDKTFSAMVLLSDVIKGIIPVLLGRLLGVTETQLALIVLFVVLGHLFPIYFQFKGGKGVATALGALLAFSWVLALVGCIVWLLIFLSLRIVSLASIVAALSVIILGFWLIPDSASYFLIALVGFFIIARHHANVRRLIQGQEKRWR
jgi:acyl phosphate:glycerol-3-phosphate acyltransferase